MAVKSSFEQELTRKEIRAAAAEQAARRELEVLLGGPLTDEEWRRQSNRLKEYVKMLARWDSEQRAAGCATMGCKEVP